MPGGLLEACLKLSHATLVHLLQRHIYSGRYRRYSQIVGLLLPLELMRSEMEASTMAREDKMPGLSQNDCLSGKGSEGDRGP